MAPTVAHNLPACFLYGSYALLPMKTAITKKTTVLATQPISIRLFSLRSSSLSTFFCGFLAPASWWG